VITPVGCGVPRTGSARFAPGQTVDGVLADLQALLDALCQRYPGLQVQLPANPAPAHRVRFQYDHG
jgi:hypothetical protein